MKVDEAGHLKGTHLCERFKNVGVYHPAICCAKTLNFTILVKEGLTPVANCVMQNL